MYDPVGADMMAAVQLVSAGIVAWSASFWSVSAGLGVVYFCDPQPCFGSGKSFVLDRIDDER